MKGEQSRQQKLLFKWIMRNPIISTQKQQEIIDLIYPVTMQQISSPVRNIGCNQSRICVWPLKSLLNDLQSQFTIKEGKFQQSINYNFTCKMCLEQTKFAKRNYRDFYYDRKLDYLIKVAKIKYIQSFKEQIIDKKSQQKIKKNFKYSKLIIKKGGGVILQYKKKIQDFKATFQVVVYQNTLNNYSQQLIFNPKDYARNLSSLKISQNITQKYLGQKIQKGFQQIYGIYNNNYRNELKNLLQKQINIILNKNQNIKIDKKQQLYIAKIIINHTIQNRKNPQLILFYPRYNITQIYSLEDHQDITNSCNKQTLKITKLSHHRLLLYTSDYTYILELKKATFNLQKNLNPIFQRPINIIQPLQNKNNQLKIPTIPTDIKYLKQWQSILKLSKENIIDKIDSIRPYIQSPIIVTNPSDLNEVFIFGGSVQGINNKYAYRLQGKSWIRQKSLLMLPSNRSQLLIENNQIFMLSISNEQNQTQKTNKLYLSELQIKNQQIIQKWNKQLQLTLNTQYFLPLRARDNQYILVDLANKQPSLYLNLKNQTIQKYKLKQEIRKFIKQLFDTRNQKSIFTSYPTSSITYNQITYNLLSYSIARHTFKIFYGFEEEWMISDLSQTLIHD